jgi:diaminopimelate decarboxylase
MKMTMNDAPFDLTLLPASARVESGGSLSVGGVDLAALAAEFGTPLYVYDEDELRTRCREYRAGFDGGVAYASKAFLCTAMARLVADEGLDLDVATGGELHVALHAGFPAERIVFHGNNKSVDELRTAADAGVGRVVVDSFDEIMRLELLADTGLQVPALLVRVTPGVEAHTHEFIETGTADSKFGFNLQNGDAMRAVMRVYESGLPFAGLHSHIGSQVFRLDSFAAAVDRMVGLVREVEKFPATKVDQLNVGGGLGVRYVASDEGASIAQYAAALHEMYAKALAAHGVQSPPKLMVEPGRSIADDALHGRHHQGDPRRPHVRRGRRRDERQPAAGHLRRRL